MGTGGEGDDRGWTLVADDVETLAKAVAEGEAVPFGGDAGGEGEGGGLQMEAENFLDASLVGPGGRASVPSPAAAPWVLGVGVDVGCHAVGFHFVFQHIGRGCGSVDGVDDGVEVVGFVEAVFLEFGHDVPHGTVGVLATIFAHADGVVGDVARRGA